MFNENYYSLISKAIVYHNPMAYNSLVIQGVTSRKTKKKTKNSEIKNLVNQTKASEESATTSLSVSILKLKNNMKNTA